MSDDAIRFVNPFDLPAILPGDPKEPLPDRSPTGKGPLAVSPVPIPPEPGP